MLHTQAPREEAETALLMATGRAILLRQPLNGVCIAEAGDVKESVQTYSRRHSSSLAGLFGAPIARRGASESVRQISLCMDVELCIMNLASRETLYKRRAL